MDLERQIDRRPWLAFALVALLGFALRLFMLGYKSLWVDEAYAAGLMGMNPAELVRMSIAGSPHPPLAFLFLKISTMVFGQGEAGLRMFPAVATAMAAIPLMSMVSRRTGNMPALWVGLLWAASPFAVSLGQEAWLYGILSLLGFGLLDVADRAWRGSRSAQYLLVPIALVGALVQHMFLLFVAAALGLYFTVPREERISWKRLAMLSALFIVLYSPFAVLMLKQAAFRAQRMSRAALDMSAVYRYRLLSRVPTVLARLIPGGLLAEANRGILSQGRQLLMWAYFALLELFLAFVLIFRSGLPARFRIWLAFLVIVPLSLFLKEDPTVRHLCILWIPMAFAAASAFRLYRPLGPLVVLSAILLLLPYYRATSFPYHRSDWRAAVRLVEDRGEEDEAVLIMGGQSGGLAWDYYSRALLPRVAFRGEDPYTERIAPGRSLNTALDSMLAIHPSVWVVHDYWGGPSTTELVGDRDILWAARTDQAMEVVHISGR